MFKSLEIVITCSLWCILGTVGSLCANFLFGEVSLGFQFSVVCPVIACYRCGLRNRTQLFKVGAYAAFGWLLVFLLLPQFSNLRAINFEQVVICSFISALIVLPGAWAIPLTEFGYQRPQEELSDPWADDDVADRSRPPEEN
ncbi:MAG: hypothetical protein COA78_33215 [Blastopirellula sp.]|nr:MAG: hypothetical protein COA78_33215 [Blastopirellula sp.]